MYRTAMWMVFAIALLLLFGSSILQAQWVMVGRAAKNRIQHMTQKSPTGGYDVATVILEAVPARVHDKALKMLRAHPDVTVTKDDSAKGEIQFRKGQQVAGLQIFPLGDNATQLVVASAVSDASPSATPLVVDAVLRVCKEVNVQCTVQGQ